MPVSEFYSNSGLIVAGDRFVGRATEVDQVRSRVFAANGGNLALVGITRVGKSSIAHNALMTREQSLLENRILVVWIDFQDIGGGFFYELAKAICQKLKQLAPVEPGVADCCRKLSTDPDATVHFRDFVFELRHSVARIVVVLDEFDHAREIWKNRPQYFSTVRSLSDKPESLIRWVFVCRREVENIEWSAGCISTLHGSSHQQYVTAFSPADSRAFFDQMVAKGIELDADKTSYIEALTGRIPYFMDSIAYSLAQRREDATDFKATCDDAADMFLPFYRRTEIMLRTFPVLKPDQTFGTVDHFEPLIKILFGPMIQVGVADANRLKRYGLLLENSGSYREMSTHYGAYLESQSRTMDLWPAFTHMETEIRQVVRFYLTEKFGDDWEVLYPASHPKFRTAFERAATFRDNDARRFGNAAFDDLLDFTYPSELFKIIKEDWPHFGPVFGRRLDDWKDEFDALSAIRNPIAHSRVHFLPKSAVRYAEAALQRISEALRANPQRR